MAFLTPRERRALQSICETLIPVLDHLENKPILARYQPTTLIEQLEEAYEKAIDEDSRRELKLLLSAFEFGLFNALFGGKWQPLSEMPIPDRERVLRSWADSRLFLRRKAFQGFKRLALFLGYSNPLTGEHPAWSEMGYSGLPNTQGDTTRHIHPLSTQENDVLTTDVLVVGSGAGGGVVAGELSASGLSVLIAEKGNSFTDAEFDGNERKANETLYEKYGALTTKDTAMMVLAGSTLGGGTVINWSASLRTPHYVLEEWSREYGFTQALSPDYQASLEAVWQRSNVNAHESQANPNHQVFERGCEALGYPTEVLPRNVKGCEDCGFCNFGCAFGSKQSTAKTYLKDAVERGARVLVRAHVARITQEYGRVSGAVLAVTDDAGYTHTVTIKAKAVVVSAGSLHTPALLRRSGLTNPHIGANLHLHPTTVVFSLFDEKIEAWRGAPLVRVAKQFMDLDGKGYGVALEVAPAHPGLISATLPWVGGQAHKHLMGQISHMANVIAITRDYYGGTVTLDKQGQPVLNYTLHPYDRAHLQKGVLEALKVHEASGANEVYSPHNASYRYRRGEDFGAFLRHIEQVGLEPNAFPLFSAHQMSSCRIGGSALQGAVKPDGETYEVTNLFVADASALPTATGVNPMMSIMGLAHYLSQHIKAKLAV